LFFICGYAVPARSVIKALIKHDITIEGRCLSAIYDFVAIELRQ